MVPHRAYITVGETDEKHVIRKLLLVISVMEAAHEVAQLANNGVVLVVYRAPLRRQASFSAGVFGISLKR